MFDLDSYFFNFYSIPNIVVSTSIFLVGLFVFIQNVKNPSNIFFFLFCLSLNLWLFGRAIMYCSREPETAFWWAKYFAKLGVVHIAPLVYAFSVHWLGLYEKRKKFVLAAFILGPILYLAILLTPYGLTGVRRYFWGYYPVYGPICYLFLAFFFTYFLAAFYNFFSEWKKATDPFHKKQIQLVTIAYLISFTGSIDYIPKVINFPFYPCGYVSVFIWTIVLAYAIVRYRIMDIQTVIHRTLMWLVSMSVAMIPFAGLIYAVYPWLSSLKPVALSLVFIVLTIVFSFYLRAIQPYLDKVFRRRTTNLNLVLNQFSGELVHFKNLRDILQKTVRVIRRNLYPREMSVLLRDEDTQSLVLMISKRIRGLKTVELSHPFLKWMESKNEIVLCDLVPSDPEVQGFKKELADYIRASSAKVIIPFVLGGKLIGVAHLGNKEAMRRYTSEEIAFLGRLKSPVSIAFSNSLHVMAMQENLRKWNEELEKKVEERTQQLQNTQAQLVQAEKLATIGTLAGGVAHEINNPLTAVLTNAQILKMTANPEDAESLDLIEEGAKRCQIIIQKLMKYARKSMGPETLVQVDINKVIDSTAAFLNYQLYQDNVELIVEKSQNLPLIEGNSNELEQVLMNLILNAKDAIKQNGVKGVISLKTSQGGGYLHLSVKDNGVGIPKENLQKIFDPFFTTKELGKGTGLGLAVSFGIIEKHKGKIQVNTQIGRGTEFVITFPVFHGE